MPNSLVAVLFLVLIAKLTLAVWSLIIFINALAEVENFSILRTIGTIIVAGLLLAIALFILWSLLLYGFGHKVACLSGSYF